MTTRWTRRLLPLTGLLAALLAAGCAAPPAATTPVATPTAAALASDAPAAEPSGATTALPTPTPDLSADARGASVPWIEYEAEDGTTNGTLLGPSRTFGDFAAESSARRSVRLDAEGQYVQFVATHAANAMVVRYAIPDAAAGGGIEASLSLYVDDTFRRKLALTSRYAWSYGGEAQSSNDPAALGPHHFFDEVRARLDEIPAGATVKLQRDSDDTAPFYVIDLVDLEQVAPPTPMPGGYVSLAECGAAPDDGVDDGRAIQDCIARARSEGTGVWIPPGTFDSTAPTASPQGIALAGVTIRGAGMWYSTIRGPYARFNCTGNNCRYVDFAVMGETTTRDDAVPDNGFNGGAGTGSRMENVWVEHTKVGWWVGAGTANVTDGLVITGSRFRNLFADGVNLCNGSSNSVVELSHFRNTGDDALASWAPKAEGGVNTNNVFRFNTVQLPWRANCFAIYGGKDNRVENNLCADVVTYPGILIAQEFDAWPFEGTTTVQRNTLIRAGGPMWNEQHGALKLHAKQGPLGGIVVRDLQIESPTFAGIQIEGSKAIQAARFENVTITDPGGDGILIKYSALGSATFDDVRVSNPAQSGLRNQPGERLFEVIRAGENSGW